MAQSTFSLTWESHKNNICDGLSGLQQNEEFVDMTLAADGHFVKVHQMVMALASPYFKDLISSAGGRHPVIYLNKISYTTLSAILEYIYTGEVLISIENLSDIIQTAKELHVKGLEDMKLQSSMNSTLGQSLTQEVEPRISSQDDHTEMKEPSEIDDEICYFEITDREDTQSQTSYSTVHLEERLDDPKSGNNVSEMDENYEYTPLEEARSLKKNSNAIELYAGHYLPTVAQYTVSNQGSIQMILNRYMYYLKHSNLNGTRQWRCVDYLNKSKCPAVVMTKDNMVLQRVSAHNHAHHDKRILKKVRAGAIFTAIKDAEDECHQIKIKVKQDNRLEKDTPETILSNKVEG